VYVVYKFRSPLTPVLWSNTVITPKPWYHLVFVADGNATIKFYFNGQKENINFASQNGANGSEWFMDMNKAGVFNHFLVIGALRRQNRMESAFHGVIDDIRIYNRSITDKEIQALYREGGWGK
jgi:hypothetical protein